MTVAILPVDRTDDAEKVTSRPLIDAFLVILWLAASVTAGWNLLGYSRDYFEYLVYYEAIPETFSLSDTRFEPGFHALAWLFRTVLELDFAWLILFLTAVSLAIKFLLFRKFLRNYLIAALIYIILFYPIHEYTQYRYYVPQETEHIAAIAAACWRHEPHISPAPRPACGNARS